MSQETKIQWCDTTVNPIMGSAGCELFPSPVKVLEAVDEAIADAAPGWTSGSARKVYKALIKDAYDAINDPGEGHRNTVTTTNIWHLRERFFDRVLDQFGRDAAEAAEASIAREITCYAATLHMNRGYSLVNPDRGMNKGHAPTFEQLTHFEGRVAEVIDRRQLEGADEDEKPRLSPTQRLSRACSLIDELESTLLKAGIQTKLLDELKNLLRS